MIVRWITKGLRIFGLDGLVKSLIPKLPMVIQARFKLVEWEQLQPQFRKAILYLSEGEGIEIGDYLEFGVCHGTSFGCMYQTLQDLSLNEVRLFGFDSFDGLPETAKYEDDSTWSPGEFNSDYGLTRNILESKYGVDWERSFLIKGWFSETLNDDLLESYNIEKASLIMIDCDMYSSAKEALTFCAALIKDISIIFFDDWNSQNLAKKNLGEKKAFDEFLEEHPQLWARSIGNYEFMGASNGRVFMVVNSVFRQPEEPIYERRLTQD